MADGMNVEIHKVTNLFITICAVWVSFDQAFFSDSLCTVHSTDKGL